MTPDTPSTVLEELRRARLLAQASQGSAKPAIANANMTMVIRHIDKAVEALRSQQLEAGPG